MYEGSERYHRSRSRAAILSLGAGVVMLGIKMGAYLATGSATVLSDALESVVHVAATIFMYICFRLISQPPDANHPYGHGKAEPLSVGIEGGMILLAALAILWEAGFNLLYGKNPIEQVWTGFILIASSGTINLLLGSYLLHVGKGTNSNLIAADGRHVLSDVWTSLGVLIGLGLMLLIPDAHKRLVIDSSCAAVIATLIIITAIRLIRASVAGLLDEVDTRLLARVVQAINEIRQPGWHDIHNLRLRSSGDITHIDFHMTVPGEWTIAMGHAAEEALERHILARLGCRGSVMIHFDYPHEDNPLPTPALDSPEGALVPMSLENAVRVKPS